MTASSSGAGGSGGAGAAGGSGSAGGAWSCTTPAACQPLVCPTDSEELLMLDGTACPDHVGLECPKAPGCTSVRCTCALNPETGTALWQCLTFPC
ncbi:hypothetical protein WME97_32680 [Sorangium sp. So ce367]|uniref:hypothetical protein n=1 Tax=Sorangium sp. So ce367 TaxID=3133305 RepID=UPI003F5E63D5